MSQTRPINYRRKDADLLLRCRQDKRSRVRKDADLLLTVRQDKKSRIKDDADLLLRVT